MWGISDRYVETLARSHDQLGYIEVIKDGAVVLTIGAGNTTDPDTGAPIFAVGGSVNMSRAAVRRQATISLLDLTGSLIPHEPQDLFAPYLTEIRVWVGLRYWDARVTPVNELASWQTSTETVTLGQMQAGTATTIGTVSSAGDPGVASDSGTAAGTASGPGSTSTTVTVDQPIPPVFEVEAEYVPIGTMVITNVQTNYPVITLTCMDRMWYCDQFTAPYVVPKHTAIVDAISNLLDRKIPHSVLDINFPSDLGDIGSQLVFDANSGVQDALLQMARLGGGVLQADQMGTFVIRDEPTTDDDTVFEYDRAAPRPMMYRPQRSIGDGPVYNAVVFTSESTAAAPVRGYAQDNNPHSITYVGRIGVHPYFASSPILVTQEQLNRAANTRLQSLLGLSNTYSVPIVPNHALEVDDVIRVADPVQGIDAPMIVDNTTVPIRAADGVQTLTCRTGAATVDGTILT